MSTKSTVAAALLSAVALLTVAACDTEAPSPPTSETTTTGTPTGGTSSPSSTSSPTPTDDAGRAVAAVVAYWAAIDALAADPEAKLESLSSVARGQALAQWQTTLADYRGKGWKQVGRSVLTRPKSVADSATAFTVTVCRDVTNVDVRDRGGTSVVTSSRPDRQSFDYQVVKDDGAFFVTEDRLEGKTCGG